MLEKTERRLPSNPELPAEEHSKDVDEEEEPEEETVLMQNTYGFDKITVWGHEAVPSDAEDSYVKGVEEWISFAQAVSQDPTPFKSRADVCRCIPSTNVGDELCVDHLRL